MKSSVGVYNDQAGAIGAVELLKANGIPEAHISILSKSAELVDKMESIEENDEKVFQKPMKIAATGLGVGAVVGPVVGALAGLGILAIPGLGVLVGVGALAGAVAGLDIGIIGGGIFSALAIAGTNKSHEEKYHDLLKEGRVLVIVQGPIEEVKKAHDLLQTHDDHHELDAHH